MTDLSEYCRELEAYLCRKNGGHLVRIVGPAFEQVCGWANRGVPLTVAFRGIDRYCERLQAREGAREVARAGARNGATGGRRRPVRVEFCEGDILDLFDDWRRAVGVVQSQGEAEPVAAARKPALTAHLERVVARLVGSRVRRSPMFEQHVEALLSEIDRLSGESKKSRGDARTAILDRLAALDRDLVRAAASELDPEALATARREAEAELAPFGSRLSVEMRARAVEAAFERLVRDSLGLPQIRYQ
jgi:hypothetical protein